jgi:hypothetical protein
MHDNNSIQQAVDKASSNHSAGGHDLTEVYKEVQNLQRQDHSNSTRLQSDMKALNDGLHAKGLLTGLELTGADSSNHLLVTENGKQMSVVASNDTDVYQATAQKTSWLQGIENIGSDLAKGAWDEVTEHPLHLLESAAIGFGIGAVAAATTPLIAFGIGTLGAGYAAYKLAVNMPQWVHDAKVDLAPSLYSQSERTAAHQGMQGVGAGAADIAAGVAGGIAGGYAGSALKAALKAPAPIEPPAATDNADDTAAGGAQDEPKGTVHHAHANQGTIISNSSNVQDAAHSHAAGGIQIDHTHLITGALPSPDGGDDGAVLPEPTGDAPVTTGKAPDVPADSPVVKSGDSVAPPTTPESTVSQPPKPVDPPAPKPEDPITPAGADPSAAVGQPAADDAPKALTPEELELQASIARNQGLFKAAGDDDAVMTAQKQSYNVMFKKITEPGVVKTLENRAGEPVQPGQWMAIRLDANGQPVIEDGITNQWPVTEKAILKAYQASPENFQQPEFIAGTKTGGAPVHMVQLTEPITIKTPWGSMSGKAGDWLANYDYDAATGTPGNDYAIVTGTSWTQTYEAVPKVSS